MKKTAIRFALIAGFAGVAGMAAPAIAEPVIGKPAPAFSLKDSNGKTVKLADFRGKLVVLEWTNHQCPYTVKHYSTQNMQRLQGFAAKAGIVWLSIVSSAPGREGYVTGKEANGLTRSRSARPAHVLLDPEGRVGHLYEAKTTPHMFVIRKDGVLAYMGAIDDNRSWQASSVKGARNHVKAALDQLLAGKPVTTGSTFPYGCSIKYKQGA
jgi:peroxiredoxin